MLRVRRALVLSVSLAALALAIPALSAQGAEARVVVAGAPRLAAGDVVVPGSLSAPVDLVLASAHPRALARFLAGITNPASSDYRHFLTPREYARRFGASAASVRALRAYLRGYGLTVGALSAGGVILHARGTTGQLGRALGARVVLVRTAAGVRAVLRSAATLPASLAAEVTTVAGLSNPLALRPTAATRAAATTPSTCTPAGDPTTNTPNSLGGYTVQQQAQLYGLTTPWSQGDTGTGQTIALYELAPYSSADVSTYFSCYGLAPSITNVNVDGGSSDPNSLETTLDIEEAGALAPGASLMVYVGPNNSTGPLDTYQRIADDNTATVVSTSWGTCEGDPSNDPAAEQPVFEQMAAQGQSLVAAAGDTGSSDCAGITSNLGLAVDDPASQPFVTAVGGLTVSSISPLTQQVWNDGLGSSGGAGGGGVSTIWSRPTWQNAPGIAASQTMRTIPDLSVMGDPVTGFIDYFTGSDTGVCTSNCYSSWGSVGGTSIGSPLVSALFAVAAQGCAVARLGFLNPTLYALARANTGFIDVTQGNNDLLNTGYYAAGPGYDDASGLGSPDPATFLADLCPASLAPTQSSLTAVSASAPAGQSVTLDLVAKDATGAALAHAPVTFTASASAGTLTLDGDPTTTQSGGATEQVTTASDGTVSVELSDSAAGVVTVTATNGPHSVQTSVTFTAAKTSKVPGRAGVAKLSAAKGGFTLVARAPTSDGGSTITRYQYSLNGGGWRSFSTATRTVKVTHLASGRTYRVRVRALNAVGAGAPSATATVKTR
jgi:subtilase family serine protease